MTAQITTLPNGLKVASITMPDAKSVNVGIWVKAGGRDERDGENGVAHMLEHMAFKGTSRRNAKEIAVEIESIGGNMNAHTAREETAYYVRILPEFVPLAIDVLFDIVTESTLPDGEIERERGVILQEIGQSLDTPDDVVFENFATASYGQHQLGRSILGTSDTVSSFSRDDLYGFMARYYGADQMILCAAGAIEHEALVEQAKAHADKLKPAHQTVRHLPRFESGRIIETRALEQAHIIFGLNAPAAKDEDRYAMMLLSILYGGGMSSRLFQEVREQRGLCYSIFSFAQMMSDTGVFGIYAGTAAEDVNEMLTVSCAALQDMRVNLSSDEIERGKAQMRASILMGQESVSGMTESMARQLVLFDSVLTVEEVTAKVAALEAADVVRIIERLIANPMPSVSLVGPSDKILQNDEIAAMLAA